MYFVFVTKRGHITLNQHLTICRPPEQKWQKNMSFSAQTFQHLQSVTDPVLKNKLVRVKFYKTFVLDKLESNISFTPPAMHLLTWRQHSHIAGIVHTFLKEKKSSIPRSSYIAWPGAVWFFSISKTKTDIVLHFRLKVYAKMNVKVSVFLVTTWILIQQNGCIKKKTDGFILMHFTFRK